MATAPFVSGFHGTGAIQRIHGVRPADPRLDPTRIPCGARAPPPQPRRALPAFPTRIQREPIAERSAGSPSHAQGSTRRLTQSASGSKGQRGFGDGQNKARRKRGDEKRTPATPPPCTPFIPYSRLREKGRGRCARNGRKNIWGGDGKGGGKKREPAPPSEARGEPLSEAPPWQGSANALPIASKEPSQNPPRRNRGSFRQKSPRSAAPEKHPQLPWQEGPQNNVGWENAVQNDARWMGVSP